MRAARTRRIPAWKLWCLGGLVATVSHLTLAQKMEHAVDAVYFSVGLATIVAVVVGVRLNRPAHPMVWYLLAAGQAAFFTGDAIWTWTSITNTTISYPSFADPIYVLAYPLFAGGLILAAKKRAAASPSGAFLDAGIITIGVSMLSWVVLMRPYVFDPTATVLAKTVSIAYPVGDLFLLGVLLPTVVLAGRHTPSTRFLGGSLALLLLTDTVYALMVIHGTYVGGSWLDTGWLVSYMLLGAAALHPSMAERSSDADGSPADRPVSRLRMTLMSFPAVAGPALLVFEVFRKDYRDVAVIACGCLMLAVVIVIRMTRLVREADGRRADLHVAMAQITHQALHDPLTGLANRSLFADRVEHASARARRHESLLAVLLLDVDDFKSINDSLGHAAGDRLLIEIAQRLTATARESDTVARLGGDEFAILVEDSVDGGRAVRVAERILEAIVRPVRLEGHDVVVSASIGVAIHDGSTPGPLTVQHADLAMYSAKQAGKGRSAMFEPAMAEAVILRMDLASEMRRSIERGITGFEVHYQPIVDLRTTAILGFEALVRWNHPTRGILAPGDFLPIAEETGLIVPLGRWILGEACDQVAAWRRTISGAEALTVSVNLSTKQVEAPDLVDDVRAALAGSGLSPTALTLELTEDLLVSDVGAIEGVLRSLAGLGVRLSVDDFGTGITPISYLTRFPITELKIDKSFVDALSDDGSEDGSLVRGMIELGHAVHLQVVAEGIEHAHQATRLSSMGCVAGQGYLFARPHPATLTESALRQSLRTPKVAILELAAASV